MAWFTEFLVKYPELTLFLVIGIGYAIGAVKVHGIGIGPVTGSLLAGILVGQFGEVPVSGLAKSFLFLLFLFGTGYSVGPHVAQALRRDGLKPAVLAVVVCLIGLVTSIAVAKLLGLDAGFAAGLTSGALTQSAAMGTATEAINALSSLPEAERARLVAHIGVADAVCYIFGTAGVILFLTLAAPKLLGIDLKAEALKLEEELGIKRLAPGVVSSYRHFEMRALRIPPGAAAVGLSVAQAEARFHEQRLFIQRIRRGDELLEARPDFVLAAGDILAVSGRRGLLVDLVGASAAEVDDRDLLDIPVTVAEVILTSRELAGRTLADSAQAEWTRSLYLRGVSRGGHELPLAPGLVLESGDLLRLVGPEPAVARAAAFIGTAVLPTTATDFVTLGLAIFLGGVAGVVIAFPIAGMKISLSTGVGVLLAGLLVGHLRTRHPLFGRIPDGAVSLMTALGLAAFVAMTGLHAGPIFVSALKEAGTGLLFGGMVVTMMPMVVGLYFGRYVLRMNPILLLGALAGAQTQTAAMAGVQERSGSPVAVLGYTPSDPIGNILLTIWGTVVVGFMT